MAFELTRDAVLKAMQRFDAEVRREEGDSGLDGPKSGNVRWYIELGGRRYPVKATVALALNVDEDKFRRVDAIARLRDLGFQVVRLDPDTVADKRRYWVFQSKPEVWDLTKAAQSLDEVTWRVPKGQGGEQMSTGDLAFLWETGTNSRLVCVGELASEALSTISELPSEQPFYVGTSGPAPGSARVRIHITHRVPLGVSITRPLLRLYRAIRDTSFLRQPQFSSRELPADAGKVLMALALLDRSPIVFKIAPGGQYWDDCVRREVIRFGWGRVDMARDLMAYPSVEALETHLLQSRTALSRVQVHTNALLLWRLRGLAAGDLIVANDGLSTILGIGAVLPEGYQYNRAFGHYPHSVAVDWWVFDSPASVPPNNGWRSAIREVPLSYLLELDLGRKAVDTVEKQLPSKVLTPSFDQIKASVRADGLYYSDEVLSTYLLSLQTRRFVILTGISGTGKTRLAKVVADAFRQPAAAPAANDVSAGVRVVQVMPYMRKFARLVLPSELAADFLARAEVEPDAKRTVEVDIVYPGGATKLLAWVVASRTLVQVLFRGEFRKWFLANCEEGQPLSLELRDASGQAPQLSIQVPKEAERPAAEANCAIIAVKPDWTDHRGLVGFFNPISGRYEATPLIQLLLAARDEEHRAEREEREAQPFFVILDEMNLARVEQYFAEFLSCLESDEPLDLHHHEATEEGETDTPLAIPRRLAIPRNVYFTGTVNVDETTYMFSPKVLDRAFTIELNEVNLRELDQLGEGLPAAAPDDGFRLTGFTGLPGCFERPKPDEWIGMIQATAAEGRDFLVRLNDLLAKHQRHFGYRVANEIARFVLRAYEQAGGSPSVWTALDLAVRMKVLPKLHGTQQELEAVLADLFAFAVEGQPVTERAKQHEAATWHLESGHLVADAEATQPRLPRTAAKLLRMSERLVAQGFASFIE